MMDKISNNQAAGRNVLNKDSPIAARKPKGLADENGFAAELLQAGTLPPLTGAAPTPGAPVAEAKQQGQSPAENPGSAQVYGPKGGIEKQAAKALADPAGNALPEAMLAPTASKRDALTSMTERSPLTLKSAASTNTAAAIAGLKPWSKDWIFEGGADVNPDLKPLIEATSPKAAQSSKTERTGGEAAEGADRMVSPQALLATLDHPVENSAGGPLSPQSAAADRALASSWSSQLEKGLQAQLQAMSGEIQNVQGDGNTKEMRDSRPSQALPDHSGSSLSGAEFLGTLAAIRGGQERGGSGLSDESGQGGNPGQKSEAGAPKLRMIEGGMKGKKALFESDLSGARNGLATQLNPALNGLNSASVAPAPTEITGHVVSGAMAQGRLSSESLAGLSTGIRSFSAEGGGEIRMRLNPQNLGELHIRVTTNGNNVGLQIQASDERAKKVLEESMSHLKESLASQQMSLSRIDLSVASPFGNAMQGDARQDQNPGHSQPQPQQNAFGDLLGQSRQQNSWNEGGGGSARLGGADSNAPAGRPGPLVRSVDMASVSGRPVMNGRIDVRA